MLFHAQRAQGVAAGAHGSTELSFLASQRGVISSVDSNVPQCISHKLRKRPHFSPRLGQWAATPHVESSAEPGQAL
jgi:hypothetical protein